MTDDEARKALAAALPPDATPQQRLDFLLRQRAAARIVGDQAALIRALEELATAAKGRPEWPRLMLELMNAEFTFGSPKKSIAHGENLLATTELDPLVRANVAASLTWKYCDSNDVPNCERVWGSAQRAYSALPASVSGGARATALTTHLQARAIVQRARGDLDGQVETLREATVVARDNRQKSLAAVGGDTQSPNYRSAVAMADYTAGQLTYALLRQGRAAESLAIAQDGLANARLAALGPDALGGWHHRMAAALVSQRRFDESLQEARASAAELRRAGGRMAGQQYSLARTAEIVSLIGLERWAEADAAYTAFMNEIRADKVSYDRSYDARLAALLAAKNNRIDAALQLMDANYRFRLRLYGPRHPQTVEARGVRGTVHLINNAPGSAMADYDDFFTVLLDTSSGWADLAPVGPRGQYLNIVLTEFLRYAARQYQAGGEAAVDRRVFERLVQVTDRLGTGVTQRALLESSAKVRTENPALTDMLARERAQRDRLRDAYAAIFATLQATEAKNIADDKRAALRDQLKRERDAAEAAQQQLADIRREQNAKFPEFVALVSPVNPGIDTIQKALLKDEAFVGLYPTREGTFAWAVNANGKRALHISRWTEGDVARRVEAMRATLDVGERLPNLPAMDFAPGLELYNELIRPLRPALAGAAVINISAAGALAAVPLAAVVTAASSDLKTASWLVREFAVVQTPGSAAFVALRSSGSGCSARPGVHGLRGSAVQVCRDDAVQSHRLRAARDARRAASRPRRGRPAGCDVFGGKRLPLRRRSAAPGDPRRIDRARADARCRSESGSGAGRRRHAQGRACRAARRAPGRGFRNARLAAGGDTRPVETGARDGGDGRSGGLAASDARRRALAQATRAVGRAFGVQYRRGRARRRRDVGSGARVLLRRHALGAGDALGGGIGSVPATGRPGVCRAREGSARQSGGQPAPRAARDDRRHARRRQLRASLLLGSLCAVRRSGALTAAEPRPPRVRIPCACARALPTELTYRAGGSAPAMPQKNKPRRSGVLLSTAADRCLRSQLAAAECEPSKSESEKSERGRLRNHLRRRESQPHVVKVDLAPTRVH